MCAAPLPTPLQYILIPPARRLLGPDVHFLWRLGRFLSFISLIFSLESGDISRNFFDGNGRNGRNGRIVTAVTAMVFLFPPAPQLAASKKVVTAPKK